jgi:hypothetical protein
MAAQLLEKVAAEVVVECTHPSNMATSTLALYKQRVHF